mmetsp:Transcript_15433/g.33774  ORF Transcript_15433/g.33774 Transcript_15433/m.33774 type:complete len:209 (+) Transcript_15433:277-903(+)
MLCVRGVRQPSLEELRKPLEGLSVAHPLHDAHHEELNRADVGVALLRIPAVGHVAVEAQGVPKLILRCGSRDVNLVPEDDEGHAGQSVVLEQVGELLLRLLEARAVGRVHEEDDAVNGGEVVLPDAARGLVATEVVGPEADVLDHKLLGVRVQRRHVGRDTVVLEHMEERRLPGIVETQEEQLGVLVAEAKVAEDVPEPVDDEHCAGC